MPTFVIYYKGEKVDTIVGAVPAKLTVCPTLRTASCSQRRALTRSFLALHFYRTPSRSSPLRSPVLRLPLLDRTLTLALETLLPLLRSHVSLQLLLDPRELGLGRDLGERHTDLVDRLDLLESLLNQPSNLLRLSQPDELAWLTNKDQVDLDPRPGPSVQALDALDDPPSQTGQVCALLLEVGEDAVEVAQDHGVARRVQQIERRRPRHRARLLEQQEGHEHAAERVEHGQAGVRAQDRQEGDEGRERVRPVVQSLGTVRIKRTE